MQTDLSILCGGGGGVSGIGGFQEPGGGIYPLPAVVAHGLGRAAAPNLAYAAWAA